MVLKRLGVFILLATVAVALVIALIVLPEAVNEEPIHVLVRLFALYGYLFLGIAVLTTPFLKEIILAFGRPFVKIHHSFSAIGLALITLHPIFNAVQRASLSVFLPRFESWLAFWTFGGRLAFIILYIAIAAAFLRMKMPKYWRPFHALTYIVLLFGLVHAILIGEDFGNPWITIIFTAIFIASVATFVTKRYKLHQTKKQRALPK